ncbi:DNA-directed RNA polymerase subunit delta [[Mycoplasma] testudinis]|uniref:DNA-directed RNA polymerase subunit delta n=1 Tax=[Mycoplasma] testudinis TaxID=33924 RepID=UPI000481EDFF|nr:DNA-directed RNA polymerase subunit delta [[Mycoplasma] testudinis]
MSDLINKAYDIALKEFKDKPFAFTRLWSEVSKASKISKQEEPNLIGGFYVDLLQDPRFVHVGDRKWRLRTTMKYEEWDKISQSMYGVKEYYEEGYEDLVNKEEDSMTEEIGPDMSNEDNVSDTSYVESLLSTNVPDDDENN